MAEVNSQKALNVLSSIKENPNKSQNLFVGGIQREFKFTSYVLVKYSLFNNRPKFLISEAEKMLLFLNFSGNFADTCQHYLSAFYHMCLQKTTSHIFLIINISFSLLLEYLSLLIAMIVLSAAQACICTGMYSQCYFVN